MSQPDTKQQVGRSCAFRVYGVPAPGGSKKAIRVGRGARRRTVLVDDAKYNAEWRDAVVWQVRAKFTKPELTGPISLRIVFFVERPKYHFGTGRNSRKVKPQYRRAIPEVDPDLTKFVRSTEDALTTAGVWPDDCKVVHQEAIKVYAEKGAHNEGAWIELKMIDGFTAHEALDYFERPQP